MFRRDTGGATLGHLTRDGCLANISVTTATRSGTTHESAGLDGPAPLAISGDGANVYVPGISSKTVAVLNRDRDGAAAGRLSGGGCLGLHRRRHVQRRPGRHGGQDRGWSPTGGRGVAGRATVY